jgi:hypothetical protein
MSRAIALLAALLTAACFNSPTSPDVVAGQPFELRAGATATLPDGVRIKFERVASDSRCPMNARCVWAGEATIAISLAAPRGNPEPRELTTTPGKSEISYGDLMISLTGLTPDRITTREIPPDAYVATFVVTTP